MILTGFIHTYCKQTLYKGHW